MLQVPEQLTNGNRVSAGPDRSAAARTTANRIAHLKKTHTIIQTKQKQKTKKKQIKEKEIDIRNEFSVNYDAIANQ